MVVDVEVWEGGHKELLLQRQPRAYIQFRRKLHFHTGQAKRRGHRLEEGSRQNSGLDTTGKISPHSTFKVRRGNEEFRNPKQKAT